MIFSFLDNLKELKVVLSSLVLAAAIVAASILYEYSANGFNIVDYVQGIQIRITGLFSNINAAGTYFGAVFPITLITGLTIKQKKYKTLFIALNIFLFLGIVFTTSRSAYFSTMISVLFMLYILNKRLLYKLIITCSILAAIILWIPQLNEFFSLFFRIESGLSQRDHLWELSLKMIKDNPIFGIGPGAYSYEMLNYFPVLLNTWVGERLIQLRDLTFGANNSHNFFLFMASDMGIMGIITSLLLPISYFRIGYLTINKYKQINHQIYTLAIGLVAAGLGLIARGMFEGIGILTYGWITMDLPFWILFAILTALYQNNYSGAIKNEFKGEKPVTKIV